MHSGVYALLFLGALAGGFVAGLAGFGTALMALGIWLYVLPPSLAVPLVLICSVVAQSSTLHSMWKSFDLTLVWPFVVGGLLGVPIGTMQVAHADPKTFKLTVGVFLLVFPIALYFNRTPLASMWREGRGRGDRLCRRHSRRAGRPVGAAPHSLGQRPRLGQGRAARHFSDLQLGGARRRALPADGHRPRRATGRLAGPARLSRHDHRRMARGAALSRAERPEFYRCRAGASAAFGRGPCLEQHRTALKRDGVSATALQISPRYSAAVTRAKSVAWRSNSER